MSPALSVFLLGVIVGMALAFVLACAVNVLAWLLWRAPRWIAKLRRAP